MPSAKVLFNAAAKKGEADVRSSLWIRYFVSGRTLLFASPTSTVATPEKFRKPVRSGRREGERRARLLVRGAALSAYGREAIDVSDGAGEGPSIDGRPGG